MSAYREAGPLGAAPPIRLGADAQEASAGSVRWQLMLVWFMRVLALLWLAQGFAHWHSILVPVPSELEGLPFWRAAAMVGFAVADLLAAVGLWLVAPWGGVLWLLTIAAQMASIVLLPGFFPGGRGLLAIDATMVIAYFIVTFQAGREESNRPD